jgi:hypothetical protein
VSNQNQNSPAPVDIGRAYRINGQLVMPHYTKAQHFVDANGLEWTADQLQQMGARQVDIPMWPREWQQIKWQRRGK